MITPVGKNYHENYPLPPDEEDKGTTHESSKKAEEIWKDVQKNFNAFSKSNRSRMNTEQQ